MMSTAQERLEYFVALVDCYANSRVVKVQLILRLVSNATYCVEPTGIQLGILVNILKNLLKSTHINNHGGIFYFYETQINALATCHCLDQLSHRQFFKIHLDRT